MHAHHAQLCSGMQAVPADGWLIRAACRAQHPSADSSNPPHHGCCAPKRYGTLPRRRRSWQIRLPSMLQLLLMRAWTSKVG